jgi:hypothetical protein
MAKNTKKANEMKIEIKLVGGDFKWLRKETEAKLKDLATDLFTDTGATAVMIIRQPEGSKNTEKETFVIESAGP